MRFVQVCKVKYISMVLKTCVCFLQETYGSFDYTSLLYLSDYGVDFGGGRFVFMDSSSNRTVEPRAGKYTHWFRIQIVNVLQV